MTLRTLQKKRTQSSVFTFFAVSVVSFLRVVTSAAASPTLGVGSVSGAPGSTASVPVHFSAGATGVASLQFTLGVPSGWTFLSATAGAAATSATKTFSVSLAHGMVIVYGLNTTVLATGDVATLQIAIPSSASAGPYPLTIGGDAYSAITALSVPGTPSTNGSVIVTPPAPTITSANTATAVTGATFTYQITATPTPTSFGATGLPAGLSINTVSGLISGTPTGSGNFTISLSASNTGGSGSASLSLTVSSASGASPFLSVGNVSGVAGADVFLPITFTPGSSAVAGVQYTLSLPSGWTLVSASSGPASQAAAKSVSITPATGVMLVSGSNSNAIGAGVVAMITIGIASSATPGSTPVMLSQTLYTSPSGQTVIPGTSQGGTIVVDNAITAPGSSNALLQNVSATRIYPNPWRSDRDAHFPWIKFELMPPASTVTIFTVSGHRV